MLGPWVCLSLHVIASKEECCGSKSGAQRARSYYTLHYIQFRYLCAASGFCKQTTYCSTMIDVQLLMYFVWALSLLETLGEKHARWHNARNCPDLSDNEESWKWLKMGNHRRWVALHPVPCASWGMWPWSRTAQPLRQPSGLRRYMDKWMHFRLRTPLLKRQILEDFVSGAGAQFWRCQSARHHSSGGKWRVELVLSDVLHILSLL